MTLKEAIIARRSVRTYTSEPVPDAAIAGLKRFLGTVRPLHSGIKTGISIISKEDFRRAFRKLRLSDAQHYVILRSVKKDGYLQNVGFIGEQIALYLAQQGIGSCWIGSAIPKKSTEAGKLPYVAAISFGRADNAPPRFSPEEANRKLIDDIVIGKISHSSLLPLLEAGRLAPSHMNEQPVRYITESTNMFIYRKRPFLALPYFENMQQIDVGAAMANIYIASECSRIFVRESNSNYPTPTAGCVYEYTSMDIESFAAQEDDGDYEEEDDAAAASQDRTGNGSDAPQA